MSTPAILVIEDNPITRKVLRATLHLEGYTVLEAPDGRTAIELMESRRPDLVLQDLILPDMDGFELLQKLRAIPGAAGTPILAHSGYLSKMEQARSLQLGFTDFLFKPVEPSRLVEIVRDYVPPVGAKEEELSGGRRILVVNDSPMQLRLIEGHLERLGFKVTTARDGAAALEEALRSPPDAIVSDVLMPRMDGFRLSLSVRLHPKLASVRVVLVSAAYTEEADQQMAAAVGASALIQSTPNLKEVTTALLEALAKPQAPLPERPVELTEEYTYRLIRQLEHQAGLNVTLTRRLALREAELAILAGYAETLKNTPAVENILDALLYRFLDAADLLQGAAYLLEPDGRLSLKAQVGYPPEVQEGLADFFGRPDLLRTAIETGEPIELPGGNNAAAGALLVTPIIAGGQRLGAIVMAGPPRGREYDWRPFARAVANQIGGSIAMARAHAEVREKEARLERIVATVADGLVITDLDGHFTFANQAAERILGLPRDEICRRSYNSPEWSVRTVEGRPLQNDEYPFTLVMAGGQPVYGIEYLLRRPDGHDVILSVNASPLSDADGKPAGTLRSIRDITVRKQAQQALARQAEDLARYNAELEQFAYVAAHDLQEPLRTVASFTQLLAQRYKGKLDTNADIYIDQAVNGALRMRRLIDDLLTYTQVARRQTELEPINCQSVFQQSLDGLRAAVEEAGASITAGELPTVMADRTRLGQLFQNLIGNALKFRRHEPPQVHVSAEKQQNEWVFSVRDNGIGIDPQHADRIFQIFERLHGKNEYEGTGIGLALCKRIVERHQGRIWVESQPGEGSTFRFTIPA